MEQIFMTASNGAEVGPQRNRGIRDASNTFAAMTHKKAAFNERRTCNSNSFNFVNVNNSGRIIEGQEFYRNILNKNSLDGGSVKSVVEDNEFFTAPNSQYLSTQGFDGCVLSNSHKLSDNYPKNKNHWSMKEVNQNGNLTHLERSVFKDTQNMPSFLSINRGETQVSQLDRYEFGRWNGEALRGSFPNQSGSTSINTHAPPGMRMEIDQYGYNLPGKRNDVQIIDAETERGEFGLAHLYNPLVSCKYKDSKDHKNADVDIANLMEDVELLNSEPYLPFASNTEKYRRYIETRKNSSFLENIYSPRICKDQGVVDKNSTSYGYSNYNHVIHQKTSSNGSYPNIIKYDEMPRMDTLGERAMFNSNPRKGGVKDKGSINGHNSDAEVRFQQSLSFEPSFNIDDAIHVNDIGLEVDKEYMMYNDAQHMELINEKHRLGSNLTLGYINGHNGDNSIFINNTNRPKNNNAVVGNVNPQFDTGFMPRDTIYNLNQHMLGYGNQNTQKYLNNQSCVSSQRHGGAYVQYTPRSNSSTLSSSTVSSCSILLSNPASENWSRENSVDTAAGSFMEDLSRNYGEQKEQSNGCGTNFLFSRVNSKGENDAEKIKQLNRLIHEIKNAKNNKIGLSEIRGFVLGLCTDQHGSRFIQQKLEAAVVTIKQKEFIFEEIVAEKNAEELIEGKRCQNTARSFNQSDARGNGSDSMFGNVDKDMADLAVLAMHPYGCRVVQRLVEHGSDGSGDFARRERLDFSNLDIGKVVMTQPTG
ncbi:Pumilio-like protein [Zancudomyces culisetae]|uniref:Pumilio-like protein n=1 Tax=Zancudomyces culisetae TaxID=1213189 RepID=A0A1R1PSM6_ZANCU|nr:Pumilio-like protein [Zancudomyces culisetae]|eukprot:OMH83951.1 Pumilio-like protein [Zancudomyces culisetae]